MKQFSMPSPKSTLGGLAPVRPSEARAMKLRCTTSLLVLAYLVYCAGICFDAPPPFWELKWRPAKQ